MRHAILFITIMGSVFCNGSIVLAQEGEIHHERTPGVVVPPTPVAPPADQGAVIEHRTPACDTTTTRRDSHDDGAKGEQKQHCE